MGAAAKPPTPPPGIRDTILNAMLSSGGKVQVHVDGTAVGVMVPEHLKCRRFFLDLGYNLPIPVPDLSITSDGVCGTFSFNRTPEWVCLPWHAITALLSEDTVVQFIGESPEPGPAPTYPPTPAKRSHLRLVQ